MKTDCLQLDIAQPRLFLSKCILCFLFAPEQNVPFLLLHVVNPRIWRSFPKPGSYDVDWDILPRNYRSQLRIKLYGPIYYAT